MVPALCNEVADRMDEILSTSCQSSTDAINQKISLLLSWCREGGSNPPRPEGRRILSRACPAYTVKCLAIRRYARRYGANRPPRKPLNPVARKIQFRQFGSLPWKPGEPSGLTIQFMCRVLIETRAVAKIQDDSSVEFPYRSSLLRFTRTAPPNLRRAGTAEDLSKVFRLCRESEQETRNL